MECQQSNDLQRMMKNESKGVALHIVVVGCASCKYANNAVPQQQEMETREQGRTSIDLFYTF